jgi:hypothetical protein
VPRARALPPLTTSPLGSQYPRPALPLHLLPRPIAATSSSPHRNLSFVFPSCLLLPHALPLSPAQSQLTRRIEKGSRRTAAPDPHKPLPLHLALWGHRPAPASHQARTGHDGVGGDGLGMPPPSRRHPVAQPPDIYSMGEAVEGEGGRERAKEGEGVGQGMCSGFSRHHSTASRPPQQQPMAGCVCVCVCVCACVCLCLHASALSSSTHQNQRDQGRRLHTSLEATPRPRPHQSPGLRSLDRTP